MNAGRHMTGLKMGMISFVLFLALCAAMPAVAEEKSNQGEDLLAAINRMEAMLLRPCDHVQKLMVELIKNGALYQETEKNRADHYERAQQLYNNKLRDFVVVKDEQGKATPGKYIKEYIDIRQKAADAGILLEEERPKVGLTKLAQQKDASRWFYFAELGSADAEGKKNLRYKLEEEYEALVGRWNKARDEFFGTFDKGDFQQYNDFFQKKAAELADIAKKYKGDKDELTNLALSGDYEHCLGEVKLSQYTVVAEGERGILGALYNKGKEGDVNSLPGMGYNLVLSKKYDPLKKPEIGGFPLGLQFKFNGNDYLKLEKELLEIRAQAAETYVFGTSGATGRAVQFFFDTTYKTAEALAAPVQLAQQAFVHPVDTISGIANGIASIPEKLDKITIQDLDRKLNELTWGTTEKLALGQLETLKNMFSPGRFDEKPGETMQQSIDRLNGKLKSLDILKSASDIESSAASIVIQALLDKGITKGLGKFDDVMKGMKAETKANTLLKQAEALKKEQKLLGVAETPDLDAKIAKLKQTAEEQLKANKELQKFVEDFKKGPAERVPGNPVAANELGQPLKFKDGAGNVVEIPVGKKLGSGATSDAFINGADDGLVVRVTNISDASAQKAARLDAYGKNVIDSEVKSDFIRTAKTEKSMDVFDANGKKQHIEFNEKVTTAKSIIEEKGGLTTGQKLSLEQATRDLNSKGFAWVDNHAGNYGFEKLPGEDRWRVVVLDPGGIYPMKGANAAEKAANARLLQTTISDTEKTLRDIGVGDPGSFVNSIRGEVQQVGGDPLKGIDLEKVGLTDAKQVAVGGGPDARPVSDLFTKTDDALLKEAADHDMKALTGDSAYAELRKKYDEGMKKLDEAMNDTQPTVDAATKKVAEGPKAPAGTDKPTGLDPDTTAKELLIAQQVAKGIDKETCAGYRKALLGGVVSEQIKAKVKECEQQGF